MYHRLGGLNNKFISSQFWGLEVGDQGVRWLGSGLHWHPSGWVLTWQKEREWDLSSSSYKAISFIRLEPHFYDVFNLNYILKTLPSNTITLGLELFWGDTVQFITLVCLSISHMYLIDLISMVFFNKSWDIEQVFPPCFSL